jgi:hypothetical protein
MYLSVFSDHRRYDESQRKIRQNNRNNNQTSLLSVDVAECIDDDIEFKAGLNINLAKGNFILDDDDAQMVRDISTFKFKRYSIDYLVKFTEYI